MDALALIQARLAMPKTHRVVVTYDNRPTYIHETQCIRSAESHAIGWRRKLGVALRDPKNGETVRIVSVEIQPIGER